MAKIIRAKCATCKWQGPVRSASTITDARAREMAKSDLSYHNVTIGHRQAKARAARKK